LLSGSLPTKEKEVAVGFLLAEKFDLQLNDTLSIQTVTGQTEEVKLVGIFDLKVASLNESWIFTTIATSQELFNYGDKITGIEIQINDVFEADVIADSLVLNNDVIVENWKAKNEDLLSGLNGQSVSSIMIQIFVLIAVVLGIASVLAITVLQKSRQIGILKAMGIQDAQASLIFLFQGLLLGLIGAVVGVVLGVLLLVLFTMFATNANGSALIPIDFDPWFITFSASIAIVSALLASLIPARKSSKLSPIEVIRNG
jgi:lipoprotein-releasing system permease protein